MRKSGNILFVNSKTNKTMMYYNLVGFDGQKMTHISSYITSKFQSMQVEQSLKVQNLTRKSDAEFWATSKTIVSYTALVELTQTWPFHNHLRIARLKGMHKASSPLKDHDRNLWLPEWLLRYSNTFTVIYWWNAKKKKKKKKKKTKQNNKIDQNLLIGIKAKAYW